MDNTGYTNFLAAAMLALCLSKSMLCYFDVPQPKTTEFSIVSRLGNPCGLMKKERGLSSGIK